MDGIVIVDKPAGWTSQDVTARLRRVFQTRRIGHGGTLDPMATGVLPVFVGRATRAVEFFEHAEKRYEASLLLGVTTDTEDTTGAVLERKDVSVTEAQIEAVLRRFRGEIQQVPPMYSAIKIGGQKLCDLARKGKEVARPARTVTIFDLTLEGREEDTLFLSVHCSKGTYIRTLCKDIGAALGCGGCMASLRRTGAGVYSIDQAVPLETLLKSERPEEKLKSVDSLFSGHPALRVTANQEKCCRNGGSFSLNAPEGLYRVYSQSGEFLMLGRVSGGVMETVKSFFAV